jgi:hypothetical protein
MSSLLLRRSDPTHLPFGYGLSASLAMCRSRGFRMTLHLRSTLPDFPSPPPHRDSQRSEHCPQSFAPRITRQHVWVGTPGHYRARSGSLSPYSILLHRPSAVSQEYVCVPPGHSAASSGAFRAGGYYADIARSASTCPSKEAICYVGGICPPNPLTRMPFLPTASSGASWHDFVNLSGCVIHINEIAPPPWSSTWHRTALSLLEATA